MKEANLILAGLKFSKTDISEAANNEKNTTLAVSLIAFYVILGAVIAFFKGNGGSSGFGRIGLTGLDAALVQFGSYVIGTFISAYIMVYVLRLFKVNLTYSGILRVYGAAIIYLILKTAAGLVLPESLAMLGVLFWLAYNFSVLFGLAGYTKLKMWQSFLTIVLTFLGVFLIMVGPFDMLVKAVFV